MHSRQIIKRFNLKSLVAVLISANMLFGATLPHAAAQTTMQTTSDETATHVKSSAYEWLDVALEATAREHDRVAPRPTVGSRMLMIITTAMYDAWAAYDEKAVGTRLGDKLRRPQSERTEANKHTAIAYATYRAMLDVYAEDKNWLDEQMRKRGFDPNDDTTDITKPQGIGNVAAAAVVEYRHKDGANQLGDELGGNGKPYSDYTFYRPVNAVDKILDPDCWQPITFYLAGGKTNAPGYLTPHWYRVKPFALERADQFRPPPPPKVGSEQLKKEVDEVLMYNASLSPEQKAVVEFMRDGPRSTGQSGHWLKFAQAVSRRDKQDVDKDAKLYFAVGAACFDAFIAAWEAKRFYDSSRPWTLVRHYHKGQKVLGWAGPGKGVIEMPAEKWHPYSPANFITPPFPGYVSGHSTVSAAAAKTLELFTGSDRFGEVEKRKAGMLTEAEYECKIMQMKLGQSPSDAALTCDVALDLPTFTATAEMAGISRVMGGYHIQADNVAGLDLGRKVAVYVFPKIQNYFDGNNANDANTVADNTEVADTKVEKKNLTPATTPTSQKPPTVRQLKIGNVNFNGSLRVRAENYGWFETPGFEDDYVFGAAVLRLSLGQQRERFDWQVEGEFPVLINVPERAIAPAPQGQLGLGASYFAANGRQDASAILNQAFVRFKVMFGDKPSSLRVGRFEYGDGLETTPTDATLAAVKRDHIAQRLIGNFGFTHIGRSYDAVHYARNTKTSNLTITAGRPVEGVFQLRSLKEIDVDFLYGAYTKPLPGKNFNSEFRLLGVHYHDGRGALKTDNRLVALRRLDTENIRLTTVGGNYIAALKTKGGTLDLLAWGVGQFGSWGNLEHRAGAIVFEGGFQPKGKLAARIKPWIRFGYTRSTGDDDPTDNRHTTFFQVLPTPRPFARFPFYNMMNIEEVYAQLKLKPHARIALRADIHHLRLGNRNDLWYAGGGAFQAQSFGFQGRPGGGRRGLGTLFDTSADINFSPSITVTLYGAGVRGGGVQSFIHPAGGDNPLARFFYAELTRRF